MLKYYLTIFLSFLLIPAIGFTANTDVVLNNSVIIDMNSENFTVSGTANFDSVTVNANNFTINLSRDAAMTVVSAESRNFTVSPVEYQKSFVCGSSDSTLELENDLWNETVTVTVTPASSGICSGGGGGGGASGGGAASGGVSVPAPVYTVIEGGTASTVTTPTATTPTITAPVTTITTEVSAIFSSAMGLGQSSADIKRLQQLLNSDPDTMISSSGVGSPGNETEYYGSLTEKAVQKFQIKYKVVSSASDAGYGYVGPVTRAKLQEVFSGVAVAPTTPTTPVTPADTSATDALDVQIQSLLQQLETLQAELNAMQ